jgi:hypothetical protein
MTRIHLTTSNARRLLTAWLVLGLVSCTEDPRERGRAGDAGSDAMAADASGMRDAAQPVADAGEDAGQPPVDSDSGTDDDSGTAPPPPECDADGDGYAAASCGGPDCDDSEPGVSPTALEVCDNGIDDDCNPGTGDLADNDFDRVRCDLDCNDANSNVSPQRAEVCDNGVDDDCNPATSDHFDADGDGAHCGVDCNDADPTVAPSHVELCLNGIDDDCDPASVDRFDADGDAVPCDVDCDDADDSVPNATGLCGGVLEYYEGFETGLGGWTTDASGVWQRAAPAGDEITEPASGQYVLIATGDDGEYPDGAYATVTSPTFDMSALSADPVLSFKLRRFLWTDDVAWLERSIDGGASWQTVASSAISGNWYNANANTAWGGDQPSWVTAQTLLTGTAGESDVRLRFVFSSNASSGDDGFAIDELRLRGELRNVAVANLIGVSPGCGSRGALSVHVQLTNLGNDTLSDVPVSYRLDGGTPVVELVPGPIAAGAMVPYTFATPLDLSAVGSHQVEVRAQLDGDEDPSDDSLSVEARTYPVQALDYADSFENDGGGWTVSGTQPSWERGQPVGDQIVGASDGAWAWVTNADGVTDDDEDSYLTSPCFDLSSLAVDPVLAFDFAMAADGEVRVEMSTDGGATFAQLGNTGSGVEWYNTDTGWSHPSAYGPAQPWRAARHTLDAASGELVQLRFHYVAYDYEAGFALDDLHVVADYVDATVTNVTVPALLCSDQDALIPSVTVRNDGNHDLTGYSLNYRLDGGAVVSQAVVGSLAPGQAVTNPLATPFDASSLGDHALEVWVDAPGDRAASNDLVTAVMQTHTRVSALDYVEDFEADDGDWFAAGSPADQWQWGTPAGPQIDVITGAGHGQKLWTTRLYGAFLKGGTSTLTSPCLDFSAYAGDPSLRFLHANDTYASGNDYTQLEMSTDGRTWTRLGSNTSGGQNWYNFLFASSGTSGWRGLWDWRTSQHPLTGAAGEEHVFLRYAFTASNSSNAAYDGTGVDLVMIATDFIDLGVDTVQSAPEGCSGSRSAEAFSVDVHNDGTGEVSSFTLSYSLDGGPTVDEPVVHTIAAGGTYSHDFSDTLDLDAAGDHTILVTVSVAGFDVNASNDQASATTRTLALLTAPYAEPFEASDGGWSVSGASPSWQHGVPTAANTVITAAKADGKIWKTNLAGQYNNNEDSYLSSPCFDFSAEANDPTVGFDLIFQTETNWDGLWVQLSTDGGANWADLGSGASATWYNSASGWWTGTSVSSVWHPYQHPLDGAAGSAAVRMRFVFSADSSSTREGVGLDNLAVTLTP